MLLSVPMILLCTSCQDCCLPRQTTLTPRWRDGSSARNIARIPFMFFPNHATRKTTRQTRAAGMIEIVWPQNLTCTDDSVSFQEQERGHERSLPHCNKDDEVLCPAEHAPHTRGGLSGGPGNVPRTGLQLLLQVQPQGARVLPPLWSTSYKMPLWTLKGSHWELHPLHSNLQLKGTSNSDDHFTTICFPQVIHSLQAFTFNAANFTKIYYKTQSSASFYYEMIKAKETGNGTIMKDELRSTGFTGREYALVGKKDLCSWTSCNCFGHIQEFHLRPQSFELLRRKRQESFQVAVHNPYNFPQDFTELSPGHRCKRRKHHFWISSFKVTWLS